MQRDRDQPPADLTHRPGASLEERPDEPPVVARMIVEIRSDGRRTIARGALEDVQAGDRVALKAEGSTPMALVWSLARAILNAPVLARTAARALLASRSERRPGDD